MEITETPTTSPKPPKEPCEVRAFAADPSSRSRDYLVGGDSKCKDPKGEEAEGTDAKGGDFNGREIPKEAEGKTPKEKMPKARIAKERANRARGRGGGGSRTPLYFVFGKGASLGAAKPKQLATVSRLPRLVE